MIPAVYQKNSPPGEITLFNRFRSQPGTEKWTVLHSLDLAKHSRIAGEADFVVIAPGKGILVTEVKSHRNVAYTHEGWKFGSSDKHDSRGPFKQASEAMHAVRKYLSEKDTLFSKLHFTHAVCFPRTEFTKKSPEWHEWQVIDSKDLCTKSIEKICNFIFRSSADHLKSKGIYHASNPQEHSSENIVRAVSLLRPIFEIAGSEDAVMADQEHQLKIFTA